MLTLAVLCINVTTEPSEINPFLHVISDEVLTYQHILSAFVSARVTVEMLSKAWLYMSAFILQHRKNTTIKTQCWVLKRPKV